MTDGAAARREADEGRLDPCHTDARTESDSQALSRYRGYDAILWPNRRHGRLGVPGASVRATDASPDDV